VIGATARETFNYEVKCVGMNTDLNDSGRHARKNMAD
jgi:hypothetical protein